MLWKFVQYRKQVNCFFEIPFIMLDVSNEILVYLQLCVFYSPPLTESYPQRLTSSVCTHPLASLINQDVPVALCSDDPSVFGNMGLSFDFFQVRQSHNFNLVKPTPIVSPQVLMGGDINGLLTLGMLARQSLEVGFHPTAYYPAFKIPS